jgi:tetratricopeptide (TPR) repeat protein
VTLIAIGALVWAGFGTYTAKKEDAAAETLFGAEKTLKTEQKRFEVPPKVDAKGQPLKDVKPAAEPSGNLEADYKDSLTQLKDVVTRFPSTQSGVVASLDLAKLYRQYNKSELSIPLLENSAKVAKHPVMKGLVLFNLGLAHEAKDDCKGAIGEWQKIQDDPALGAFQANTLIKEALCYEKLGQKDKAIEIYGRFDAAEGERKALVESVATRYQLNLKIPLQMQSKDKVEAFEKEITKSHDAQRLEALLSDREAVKAAKKYLQILKQGQS